MTWPESRGTGGSRLPGLHIMVSMVSLTNLATKGCCSVPQSTNMALMNLLSTVEWGRATALAAAKMTTHNTTVALRIYAPAHNYITNVKAYSTS